MRRGCRVRRNDLSSFVSYRFLLKHECLALEENVEWDVMNWPVYTWWDCSGWLFKLSDASEVTKSLADLVVSEITSPAVLLFHLHRFLLCCGKKRLPAGVAGDVFSCFIMYQRVFFFSVVCQVCVTNVKGLSGDF